MYVEFGIAGIPLSCKGRTVLDGILDARQNGLDVMEIEMLRENMDIGNFTEIKKTSIENNIRLTIHAPYYTNISGDSYNGHRCINTIKQCGLIGNKIGAKLIVVHGGMYHGNKEKSLKEVIRFMRKLNKYFKRKNIHCKIGLETSGKQQLFGHIDEVIEVCKSTSGIVPILNFAHIHARGNGCLKDKDDFQTIFNKLKPLKLKKYYTVFSGVNYGYHNEINLTPIKKSDLKFSALCECLFENKYNVTIISGSPLLEHDAHYMKMMLEKIERKYTKNSH